MKNARSISARLLMLSACGAMLGPVCRAQIFPKLPVPPTAVCPVGANQSSMPWQIALEWERLGGPNGPIGCPTAAFVQDTSFGGFVQFQNGQIAISTNVWESGVVAVYIDALGRIIADWTVSWTNPSHYNYSKFVVRWDFNGVHYSNGNPCERGEGDQCDVLADMTEIQAVLLHYYHDTHLRTKGTFPVPADHGAGYYRIAIEGCDKGTVGGSTCRQGWMHPVGLFYSPTPPGPSAFPVDFRSVPTQNPTNMAMSEAIFFRRAAAIVLYNACQVLPWSAYRNEQDYGTIILAKLAYTDFYVDDHCPGRVTQNRLEGFISLTLQSVESKPGTTIDSCPGCRTGEYDVALSAYVAVLLKFGSILPQFVADHISKVLLNQTGGASAANQDVFIEGGIIPESENHLNLIESARFLTNDFLFAQTGDATYDNDANGLTAWWLGRLQNFLTSDFIEYNARPYQSYTAIALQNLFSFARNAEVKTAAGMVLDYISAKMAVSSNQARRAVPYRRLASDNLPYLVGWAADPQAARNLALVGDLDILTEAKIGAYWGPVYGSGDMLRAVLSSYRIPQLLMDLMINPTHRLFYEGFHHYADELYAGSPSFLISAGGHSAPDTYLVAGHGNSDDEGLALPTTIMPTGRFIDRDYFIQFKGLGNDVFRYNMCVAPNFACGLTPTVPPILLNDPFCLDTSHPNWTFINFSGPCSLSGTFGSYTAVYQQSLFGLAEIFDTQVNPNLPFSQFVQTVLADNPAVVLNPSSPNTYTTITGQIVQFQFGSTNDGMNPAESKILSITNGPPVPPLNGPAMPSGEIISSPEAGVINISNSYLGVLRTLDFHDQAHPVVNETPMKPFNGTTCLTGFVGRQANSLDLVCVTQSTQQQIANQNVLGPSRTNGNVCKPGFEFRLANSLDHVCVSPTEHDQVAWDNLLAPSRRAIP